jgi:FeS assembly SUF system protein
MNTRYTEWLNQPEQPSPGAPAEMPLLVPKGGSQDLPLAEPVAAVPVGPTSESELSQLEDAIIAQLKTIFDPEIPVNIYDLGLIYSVNLDADSRHVEIEMTLTAPGCPVAQTFPGEVERRVMEVSGVNSAHVELVWEPPWTKDRMDEATRLTLGMF